MVHIGNDLKVVWSPVSIEIVGKFTLDRVLSLLCLIGLLFVYHFSWFLISVIEWVKQDVQNSCSIPCHHGYLGLLEHVRNNYSPLYYELHALWLAVVEWKYFFLHYGKIHTHFWNQILPPDWLAVSRIYIFYTRIQHFQSQNKSFM